MVSARTSLSHGVWQTQNVSWNMRGAWLLQTSVEICGPGQDSCRLESLHALYLLVGICTSIMLIICAFAFFREDKEEQITPLCPQLVVKDGDLSVKLPLNAQADNNMVVTDLNGVTICKVAMDWPDPFRPGASGVAATVRLQNNLDLTLATVVARSVPVVGQGLALCRAGCEIFGFVEPDGPTRYNVRHRTGVHLLTLVGDFVNLDIEGINPVGSKVCWFKQVGNEQTGKILQHVDAGLVLCSLLSTQVHRRLLASKPVSLTTPKLSSGKSTPRGEGRSTPRGEGRSTPRGEGKTTPRGETPQQTAVHVAQVDANSVLEADETQERSLPDEQTQSAVFAGSS